MKQTSFSFANKIERQFGGSLNRGKRKTVRPISAKVPIHLVIKSNQKDAFNPSAISIKKLIEVTAKKFSIRIYEVALNWSHVHLVIKLRTREDYKKFIRAVTSLLAQKIRSKKPGLKAVFSLRPFTRLLAWGKDFKNVLSYHVVNQLESWGQLSRKKCFTETLNRKKMPRESTIRWSDKKNESAEKTWQTQPKLAFRPCYILGKSIENTNPPVLFPSQANEN